MSECNGYPVGDSAAKRRADKLTEELGINLWAKYPADLIEFRMDRPPKEPDPKNVVAWQKWEEERRHWKPVHGPKVRVYSTYMRYSWCWPICLPYAVVTDDRDEILRDHKGRPLTLSQEAVSDILGLSKQRVSAVVLDLVADKLVRIAASPGRQHSMAVYLEPKPSLTPEERRVKSTLDATRLEGPRLEPAVLRRFSSLFKQLGPDDALISVPAEEGAERLPVSEYRSRLWREILDQRTLFLNALKTARYSERKAYADTATRVRNLIDQRESPDVGLPPAPGASALAASSPAGGSSEKSRGSSSSSSVPAEARETTTTAPLTIDPELSAIAELVTGLHAIDANIGCSDDDAQKMLTRCRERDQAITVPELLRIAKNRWPGARHGRYPLQVLIAAVVRHIGPTTMALLRTEMRKDAERAAREEEDRIARCKEYGLDPDTLEPLKGAP